MSIAARLNQLRGVQNSGCRDVAGNALGERLRRARPLDTAAHDLDDRPERLAQSIGAVVHDGLLIREVQRELPAVATDVDLRELPELRHVDGTDWVYLDTETTGLSGGVGNLAFMVGLARLRTDSTLAVRQYILGRFGAERAMLDNMLDWIGPDAVLVSYNGKCFDMPLLESRRRLHRISDTFIDHAHLDLMYTVRRAFRRYWPDCRLQTAERRLLGFKRIDDLPGAEAPAAWQDWLRRGQPAALQRVVTHNEQDVVSLALLQQRLVDVYASAGYGEVDHAAVGKAWRDAGDEALACRCWEGAGERLSDAGQLLLATSYRRQGWWDRAEAIWMRLFAQGNQDAAGELSKLYEHRRRDPRRAMRFAAHCAAQDREVRCARLARKLDTGSQISLAYGDSV